MAKLVESLELSFWARATVLVPRYILALFLLHDHKSFDQLSLHSSIKPFEEQTSLEGEGTNHQNRK